LPFVLPAQISEGTRALLLYLYTQMSETGTVSVPRERLAVLFGVTERRISKRIAEAAEAGLLTRTGGGWKGMTAMYSALIPTAKATPVRVPIEQAKGAG
jgi:hypothetical protein